MIAKTHKNVNLREGQKVSKLAFEVLSNTITLEHFDSCISDDKTAIEEHKMTVDETEVCTILGYGTQKFFVLTTACCCHPTNERR